MKLKVTFIARQTAQRTYRKFVCEELRKVTREVDARRDFHSSKVPAKFYNAERVPRRMDGICQGTYGKHYILDRIYIFVSGLESRALLSFVQKKSSGSEKASGEHTNVIVKSRRPWNLPSRKIAQLPSSYSIFFYFFF